MLTQLGLPQGATFPGQLGAPLTASPRGAVIFVLSTVGSDTRSRLKFFGGPAGSTTQGSIQGPIGDPQFPLASVFGTNGALSFCSANRGDLIVILPGHLESLTAIGSYAIPAGVTITGIGGRSLRPQFTYAGDTTTVITPGAGSVIENCHFDICTNNASISLVKGFNFTGAGAMLINCRILQSMATATHVALNAITISADGITLSGVEIDSTAIAGAASAIASGAAVAQLKVLGCDIRGDYSVAPLTSASTNHITLMDVNGNYIFQANGTAKCVINFTTSSTGIVRNNTFIGTTWSSAANALTNSTSVLLRWTQNFGFDDGAGAVSGVLVPAAGTIA